MEICKYVYSDGKQVSVGDIVESGWPRPCVVAPITRVLRRRDAVKGPCSPTSTARCTPPGGGDAVVWFEISGRYLVYKRQIFETVHNAVKEVVERAAPATVLLAGASRTGKTTLAKLMLEMYGLPYRAVSGDEVLSKWVGESEQNVREMLMEALRAGRSIIIDEFDGLLPGVGRTGAEGDEVVKTRTAFLHYMDRVLQAGGVPILVFATTNVDVSMLPEEVRNRFKLVVEFPKPSAEEYKLLAALYGVSGEVVERAVAAMSGLDVVEKCARGDCQIRPEYLVMYSDDRIAADKPVAEVLAEIAELTNQAEPYIFTLKGYSERHIHFAAALTLSAITRKPVVITRDREEYAKILKHARYYDVIVAPLKDTADAKDIWAAYRRIPIALLNWQDAPRGVPNYTVDAARLTVGGRPAADWLREAVKQRLFRRTA